MSGSILLVTPTLGVGGAERVFVDLAGALADRGRDVHLAWAGGSGELASGIAPTVDAHDLGRSRTATAVPRLRALVGDLSPSVVVSSLFHGNLLAALAVRGRRRRPGLVFTEHVESGVVQATAPRRLERWSPTLVPLVYRAADAVVAVSPGVARDLEAVGHLPAAMIHQIPNPIDLDRIDRLAADAPRHPWLRGDDRRSPVIVAAGRLVGVKGFDHLVRVVAALTEPVRLVVLGEGPERVALQALVDELGAAARVDLFGAVDNPYAEMAAADMVVSTSRTEALPTVLIEALHLRRPVVATDCSAGVREVLDDGRLGRLVPVDDRAALGAAITATVAGTVASVPSGAMSRYSAESVVSRYERLIDDVAATRS